MQTTDNMYWKVLPQKVQEKFLESSTRLDLKRGENIYTHGQTPKGIYFIQQGLVGLVILGMSGKEHLLRFFRRDQFFGHRTLFSNETYHGTTVALEPTKILMVPKEVVLKEIEEDPSIYKYLIEVISKELRRCEVQRVMILENQILARTAQSLIYLKDLHPHHPWTRQEIANFCASTVSTVIKAMAKLESMNLIKQDGRSIEIIDREGLINLQDQDHLL